MSNNSRQFTLTIVECLNDSYILLYQVFIGSRTEYILELIKNENGFVVNFICMTFYSPYIVYTYFLV